MRAWRHRDRLDDPATARTWLFSIAANAWRDQLRRSRLRPSVAGDTVPEPSGHDVDHVEQRERVDAALALIDALPDRQREVFYLSVCESLPTSAIASILGLREHAVRSNLSLARRRLREQLVADAEGMESS